MEDSRELHGRTVQFLIGQLDIGYVASAKDGANQGVVVVVQQVAYGLHPEVMTVAVPEAIFGFLFYVVQICYIFKSAGIVRMTQVCEI